MEDIEKILSWIRQRKEEVILKRKKTTESISRMYWLGQEDILNELIEELIGRRAVYEDSRNTN